MGFQFHNISLIEQIYEEFLRDPSHVEASWRHFFEGMKFAPPVEKVVVEESNERRIDRLINAYRTYGHLFAKVNPIATQEPTLPPQLSLEALGFKNEELVRLFPTLHLMEKAEAPLQEIIARLQKIYSASVGIEYMNNAPPDVIHWLQKEIESTEFPVRFSKEKKLSVLAEISKATLFEIFLHTKYVGQKRFSLEGAETLIPILHEIIETGAELGMSGFFIGMAHRGRLNVLTNIMKKSFSMVFSEFEGYIDEALALGTGDVKYHQGYASDLVTSSGKPVHVSLIANASHLESVDPIVEGKVRARQVMLGDEKGEKVVPILIHGDASIAGQGVVYETMQLYKLKGYGNGGTIHIIVNNQIGFTTLPKDSRSTPYCTDIAKGFFAPVFHVNAEDPEGCLYATKLSLSIRQKYHCDVFIDLNGYRKYGHNESDEPSFTQPLQYALIRNKKTIREIYLHHLIEEGAIKHEEALALEEQFKKDLHQELEEIKIKKEAFSPEAFGGSWKQYSGPIEIFKPVETAVSVETLKEVTCAFCKIPQGFHLHPKVEKLFKERLAMGRGEHKQIDWGMGEHLAFATLLWEGIPVRLAGQDSLRATFSQRHALWVDQSTGEEYTPLAHLKADQGRFEGVNSPLSEFAALGFELGYSFSYPSALVLWEAQYGDFANGGQVIMDQYLSCSEQKWMRYSGLTLLLPHGYEGQGPEHSSARLERFLQLCGQENMQIALPTTPAQYFHLLRRQVMRPFRKPLVVFTPKGLLRAPSCVSTLQEFSEGCFEEILDDVREGEVSRVLLCSGRIYYDLTVEREKRGRGDIAILRIEELYPLHKEKLRSLIKKYGAKEIAWVQEEPQNMGALSFIMPLLREMFESTFKLMAMSRPASAATATGSHRLHVKEHEELMNKIFS